MLNASLRLIRTAAIAMSCQMATRNTADMQATGVPLRDFWSS